MVTRGIVAFWVLSLILAAAPGALASELRAGDVAIGSGSSVVGAALAHAEEAICRSVVNYGHVRGVFGEAVMERVVLGSQRGGGWQSVSVSPQPQGIDGLYIKRDGLGRPKGLLVGEAKFGTSRLGITRDGRQMSSSWTSARLANEASRYQSAGTNTTVTVRARPRGLADNPDLVKVRLAGGRDGYFWRTNKFDEWSYDGPQGTLKDAQAAALRDGRYIQAAAAGKITYRQRVYKVNVRGNVVSVTVQNAKPTAGSVEIKEIARVKIDTSSKMSYMREVKNEIARQLLVKHPYINEEEAKTIASAATRKVRNLEDIVRQTNQKYLLGAAFDIGKAGLITAAFAGVLDFAVQVYSSGQVDCGQAGGMALGGFAAGTTGAATHHLVIKAAVNNAIVNQFFVHTAKAVGLPTSMGAASILGQGLGSALGTLAFAGVMYASGQMEGGEAARMAVAGTSVAILASVAKSGIIMLAATYGTAGTGVAISTLSGAAASNAALAYLGGGTIAAGGGGMALGSLVATGGAAVVLVATTAVIYWGYAAYDNKVANERNEYKAKHFANDLTTLSELSKKRWPLVSVPY